MYKLGKMSMVAAMLLVGTSCVHAGTETGASDWNTFMGANAGDGNTADYNTFIGARAGINADAVRRSVFLGNQAGANATRNQTLYIDNSNTESPLIYGEFDTNFVKVNGDLNTTGFISSIVEANDDLNIHKGLCVRVNNTTDNVRSDAGIMLMNVRDNSAWQIRTWDTDKADDSILNGDFAISKEDSGAKELVITGMDNPNGMGLMLGNGSANRSGQWLHNSNSQTMINIEELDATRARNLINTLVPRTYNCAAKPAEEIVGFLTNWSDDRIEVPYPLQTNDGTTLSSMEIVAALTKMVQDMDAKMQTMQAKIDFLNGNQETIMAQLEYYYAFGMDELDRLNLIDEDFEKRISDLEPA